MAVLIMGLFLLFVPFLFIDFFSDKKRGFVYIFFFWALFHTFLAVFTQFFGIFYYGVILGVNLLAAVILLILYFKTKIGKKLLFKIPKIDWAILIVIVIAFLSLYQVHYNYTGKVNLIANQANSYHEVKNMKYVYPYFSDEWYAVSLIEGSIDYHSLPFKNTFDNSFFPNLEMFFHSFLAEIILILGLNPLIHYNLVSLFINILIIVLAYVFLRINKVSKLASVISSLAILYIASSANLPGLWHLIPLNLGIMAALLGFCFISLDDLKMTFLSFLLVLLFYPPLALFFGLGLLVFIFERSPKMKAKMFKIIGYFTAGLLLAVPVVYILLMLSPLANHTNYILSKLFYTSFTGFFMPQYNFYYIIPIPIILLAVFGQLFIYKNKKWIFAQFILGVLLWIFYSFSIYRIVINYERAVIFMAIIVTLIAGFGLDELAKYISSKFRKIKFPIFKYLEIGAVILFLILIPSYTRRETWRKLILINSADGMIAYPAAPANNYLVEDDLKIFKNLKDKRFLSLPWKGTVIGVATGAKPVLTKEGTISIGSGAILYDFLNADCPGKEAIAEKLDLDYIYIYQFDCPNFQKTAESDENLILYKIEK